MRVAVLAKYREESDDPNHRQRLESAENDAALAKEEIHNDFPALHGFAVVALWSWLEHFVKGLLKLWITNVDEFGSTSFLKTKVRIGEFLQLGPEQQAERLVDLLEHELSSDQKFGQKRFSAMLEPFGLATQLEDPYARDLYELQQVRNSVVHKDGNADQRLLDACPWLDYELNQGICISGERLRAYSDAAGQFLLLTLYKAGDLYGLDLRKTEP